MLLRLFKTLTITPPMKFSDCCRPSRFKESLIKLGTENPRKIQKLKTRDVSKLVYLGADQRAPSVATANGLT